jgi:DNA-binding Lrp family transcriptional regulator
MIVFNNYFFRRYYRSVSTLFLNNYEKEKRVIELHLAGKTIREIAKEVHMSFTPISKIIKTYERKKELQAKREESNQSSQIKKPSLSSRAFKLFIDGKKPTEVVIELDIPPEKVEKLWSQFLKSERMEECYDFFQMCQYDIPTILSINNFIKKNNIQGKDIANVLRKANGVINLNQTILNLKGEIERLKQMKNNYTLNQNTMKNLQPVPLGPLPRYYNW